MRDFLERVTRYHFAAANEDIIPAPLELRECCKTLHYIIYAHACARDGRAMREESEAECAKRSGNIVQSDEIELREI